MREIKLTVYKLDELEPDAQQRAIELVAEKLGGEWWDESDNDDIADVIRYTLAHGFGTPGLGDWGVGDFPGIDGVELVGWDLGRSDYIALKGYLTRKNAPGLPWSDAVDSVTLEELREGTDVQVVMSEDDSDEEAYEPDTYTDNIDGHSYLINVKPQVHARDCAKCAEVVKEAVEDAMHEARRDGRKEIGYKSSEEYAKDDIEANEREFYEDGSLYP